jgi:WD40 repeat protein
MTGVPPRVFLSYARKDGEAFATALRRRLEDEEPEITLWQDLAELEGGRNWWTEIEKALDQVKFLVIVMTPAVLASEIAQREWRYARERGRVNVYPVKGVPDDHIDFASLPEWMRQAEWFDIGHWTGHRWEHEKQWDTFTHYLKSDRQPLRVPFLAPDPPSGFVSRPREFAQVLEPLVNGVQKRPVAITTALQGAGGYGKTSLAAAVCRDDRVTDTFYDGVLWTSLGQAPRVVDELARWYYALTGERPAFVDAREASIELAARLEHRHCLLVIDDVWDRHHLEPFLEAGKHSARLITTRRFDLVSDMARVRVDEMTADQATAMLAAPFGARVVPEGKLAILAKRLGEWPLLLRLAASLLRGDLERGESAEGALADVEGLLEKYGVTAFDQADAAQRDEAVRRTVAASMDRLSAEDRRRFHELAIFPEETAIPLSTLAAFWGLDAIDTRRCARRLDDVALVSLDLQDRGVVTLHDVMRAYVRQECPDLRDLHTQLVAGYGDPHQLPDAYGWRWLPYHLVEAGQADQVRALLLTPTWLDAQLRAVGPYVVIQDFTWVQNDRDLELVHGALRLSLPALASDPRHFWEQLWGRIPAGASEPLDAFRSVLLQMAPPPRFHARWPNLHGPGGALRQVLSHPRVNGARPLPDGRVLSWSRDGTLRIWDLATGAGRSLTGHEGLVRGAMVLPAGQVLSWSDDRTLRVWDLDTGEGRPLIGHTSLVAGALVLPDGRVVSWSSDGTLRVWALATGEGHPLRGHDGSVRGALALPDGRVASWSEDETWQLWDLATGKARPLTAGWVSDALALPDGRVLSWSDDGTLRVWNLATGGGRALTGHTKMVRGALALPDGRVLSWSEDRTLRVWDLATGDGRLLMGHTSLVAGALVLPDGRVLSWGDGELRVWDLAIGEGHPLRGHRMEIEGALVLPDGRLVSWGYHGELRVWDLATSEGRPLTGHESKVTGALVLPDGRVLSWSEDGTLRVWDVTRRDGATLTGHTEWVEGALAVPDGRVLSWSGNGTLRVWDLATGEGRFLTGHEGSVAGALLLPDGQVLWWSRNGTLQVWDLATGARRPLTGHDGPVGGALVLSDGRVLSWSDDGTLRAWDLATGEGRPLMGHQWGVSGALVLPDKRVLSWSDDGTLRVWYLGIGKGRLLTGHKSPVIGVLTLPDGRVLSWGQDGTLRVWDLATGAERLLWGHEGSVKGALALPDGRVLSWNHDGTLRVWDLTSGVGHPLRGRDDRVTGALVLPDGRVLSWSEAGTLRVWDLTMVKGRPLTGHHQGEVKGALELPNGKVLSWASDRTLRLQVLNGTDAGLAFWFDAMPTVVLPTGLDQFFVGDALGRVHVLEVLHAPF